MTAGFAILASGNGSNAQAIFEAIAQGRIDARVTRVVSNNPRARVLERAARFGIPVWSADHREYPDRESFDRAMLAALEPDWPEFVVLAGYMRLLSRVFLEAFAGRILNIHPALLPAFTGAHAIADALAYGTRLTGCTVHFVEEKVDSGPVIIQAAVPILPRDTDETLLRRMNVCEHHIYPQAIQWLAQGRLETAGRQVAVAPADGTATRALIMVEDVPCLVWPPLERDFYRE